MAGEDWNATMWILDTLLEDRYSFTELADYIGGRCGRDKIHESLTLLARQDLICVLEGPAHGGAFQQVDAEERSKRIQRFFEIADADRLSFAANWVALTESGQSLLRLLGIGRT